jgi:hypothetical protein
MVAVCRLWGAYPDVEKVHAAPQLSKNSVMILKIRRANLFEETCFWLHQHADETCYDYLHYAWYGIGYRACKPYHSLQCTFDGLTSSKV